MAELVLETEMVYDVCVLEAAGGWDLENLLGSSWHDSHLLVTNISIFGLQEKDTVY